MYYKELTRVKRGLLVLTVILALIISISLLSHTQHGVQFTAQVGDQPQEQAVPARHVHRNVIHPRATQADANAARAAQPKAALTQDDNRIPLSALFAIAGVIATIFAGAYGGSLALENSGHLEVAWTKPASRNRYALITIGVDLLAAVVAFALSLVAATVVLALGNLLRLVYVDADAWQNLARFLLLPVAFTGLWQALTASMRAQAGTVIGFSVVACVVLLGLGVAPLPTIWHVLVASLNFFNPIAYGTYATGAPQYIYPFQYWQLNVTALGAIGIGGIVIALMQWRKLEA